MTLPEPLSPPVLLAFDTSTEVLALAVSTPAGAFTQLAEGGARASATLLPQALRLLAQAGVGLHDVQALAFGCGPGAFTGLRTACAVAQGLGLGLGKPLLPIDSLLIVAEDARQQVFCQQDAAPVGPDWGVTVVMDARMQEVYAAQYRYRIADAGWQVVQPPALLSLQALAPTLGRQPMPVLAGSAWGVFGERLGLPTAAHRVETEHNRAAALLRLALRAWAEGLAVDASLALPLYLRDKVAQTSAERQATQATQANQALASPATTGPARVSPRAAVAP